MTNEPITEADYDAPDPTPRVLAALQLKEAWNRYCAASDNFHAALYKIAVGEVVNPICGMDEMLWLANKTDKAYEMRRDADLNGRGMNGLRYVRNAHTHNFVTAAETPVAVGFGWMSGPSGMKPTTLIQAHWRSLIEDERTEDLNGRQTIQRNVYEAELAGHSVKQSLLRAMRFLRDEGCLEEGFGRYLDTYAPAIMT